MLKVAIKEVNYKKTITISDEEKSFDILFGDNGDLYFSPCVASEKLYKDDKPIEFIIVEHDTEIYPLFNKLYNNIIEYCPYDKDELDLFSDDDYEKKKDSYREYPLVHDGIISWRSDEDMQIIPSILNITKENNIIKLEFIKCQPVSNIYLTYSIRFRNSGSRYDPFNIRFMELYNELCKIDFTYHQITIQEYLKDLDFKNVRKLKK